MTPAKEPPCAVGTEKKQNRSLAKDPVCSALEQSHKTFHLWRKLKNGGRPASTKGTPHHHSADRVLGVSRQFSDTLCCQSGNFMEDLLVLDDDKLGALFVMLAGRESGRFQYLFERVPFDRVVLE